MKAPYRNPNETWMNIIMTLRLPSCICIHHTVSSVTFSCATTLSLHACGLIGIHLNLWCRRLGYRYMIKASRKLHQSLYSLLYPNDNLHVTGYMVKDALYIMVHYQREHSMMMTWHEWGGPGEWGRQFHKGGGGLYGVPPPHFRAKWCCVKNLNIMYNWVEWHIHTNKLESVKAI